MHSHGRRGRSDVPKKKSGSWFETVPSFCNQSHTTSCWTEGHSRFFVSLLDTTGCSTRIRFVGIRLSDVELSVGKNSTYHREGRQCWPCSKMTEKCPFVAVTAAVFEQDGSSSGAVPQNRRLVVIDYPRILASESQNVALNWATHKVKLLHCSFRKCFYFPWGFWGTI